MIVSVNPPTLPRVDSRRHLPFGEQISGNTPSTLHYPCFGVFGVWHPGCPPIAPRPVVTTGPQPEKPTARVCSAKARYASSFDLKFKFGLETKLRGIPEAGIHRGRVATVRAIRRRTCGRPPRKILLSPCGESVCRSRWFPARLRPACCWDGDRRDVFCSLRSLMIPVRCGVLVLSANRHDNRVILTL